MSAPQIVGGGVLGEKITEARRQLDIFKLPEGITQVTYSSDEVTSVCPITGQPDFYEVSVILVKSWCGIESKSLKLYLQSFREDGQFCEQFADTIAGDIYTAIMKNMDDPGPETLLPKVAVTVTQKPRGGVSIAATGRRG